MSWWKQFSKTYRKSLEALENPNSQLLWTRFFDSLRKKASLPRKEIMKSLLGDIKVLTIPLDAVMATLKEGGLVFDYVQGATTLYQSVETKPPINPLTPPKGTP